MAYSKADKAAQPDRYPRTNRDAYANTDSYTHACADSHTYDYTHPQAEGGPPSSCVQRHGDR